MPPPGNELPESGGTKAAGLFKRLPPARGGFSRGPRRNGKSGVSASSHAAGRRAKTVPASRYCGGPRRSYRETPGRRSIRRGGSAEAARHRAVAQSRGIAQVRRDNPTPARSLIRGNRIQRRSRKRGKWLEVNATPGRCPLWRRRDCSSAVGLVCAGLQREPLVEILYVVLGRVYGYQWWRS